MAIVYNFVFPNGQTIKHDILKEQIEVGLHIFIYERSIYNNMTLYLIPGNMCNYSVEYEFVEIDLENKTIWLEKVK